MTFLALENPITTRFKTLVKVHGNPMVYLSTNVVSILDSERHHYVCYDFPIEKTCPASLHALYPQKNTSFPQEARPSVSLNGV